MSDALDRILAEARAELGTREAQGVDWSTVDAALFDRLDRERRAERATFASPRQRGLTLAAVGLAAAAVIVAVLAGKTREPFDDGRVASVEGAGTIVAIDGAGTMQIDGKPVTGGAAVKLGDVLETGTAKATLDRPGRLTLTMEPQSRIVVTHVQGALVLSVERGAVEAQVVPVIAGEAFAVDVEHSRVAVHGTHLRVERAGERVIVDLNEGVVSIGEAPRAGSLVGTLVNAPAHVEFLAADAAGTLTQTHDVASVRAPEARAAAIASGVVAPPRPEAFATRPAPAALPGEPRAGVRPPPTGTYAKIPVPAPEPSPEEAIAVAVRQCLAERPHPENVTIVVSTRLHLDLADDGSVRAARFDPPVAPDVNACAAPAIYRQRFGHGGAVAIPVDFTE
jgi:ferric-dicitrate binding protein FerR (iron transport regulator)